MTSLFRKRPKVISADAYQIVGGIVRAMPDGPLTRQDIANHFATEFNRRSRAFDPIQWERLTGGRPAPNSAAA